MSNIDDKLIVWVKDNFFIKNLAFELFKIKTEILC